MDEQKNDNELRKVYLSQLQQTNELVIDAISRATQIGAILIGAWAVLLGIAYTETNIRGQPIIIGALALMILAYLTHRIGKVIAALGSVSLQLERDLGVDVRRSPGAVFLINFRSKELYNQVKQISDISDNNDFIERMNESKLSFYGINQSRTSIVLLLVGGGQFLWGFWIVFGEQIMKFIDSICF